jgi:hypothetical protein
LIEGAGTLPPEDGWDDGEFLAPIVASTMLPSPTS